MIRVILLAVPALVCGACDTPADLICCGAQEVFIIGSEKDNARKWTWRASDSPSIPKKAHAWFRTTDECKPVGKCILITSSSGGVALIRREDKACLFLAHARNAHSACLLPGDRVNVMVAFGYKQQKTVYRNLEWNGGERVTDRTYKRLSFSIGIGF